MTGEPRLDQVLELMRRYLGPVEVAAIRWERACEWCGDRAAQPLCSKWCGEQRAAWQRAMETDR